MRHLTSTYFRDTGERSSEDLLGFTETLKSMTQFSNVEALATFRYGATAARRANASEKLNDAVTCIRFRRDDEFVSIAGHSGGIQLFGYQTLLHRDEQDSLSPLTTIHTEATLSTSWDPLDLARMAAGGESGVVNVWDVGRSQVALGFKEHRKQVNYVDYCRHQKGLLASASDDKTVRLWHYSMPTSTLTVTAPAVCHAVQFHPFLDNQVVFSCADGDVHGLDIRFPSDRLFVLKGEDPVTNFAFISRLEIATQSLDSTVRLWSTEAPDRPNRQFQGHRQRRRTTVAFSARADFLVTGSEDNALYFYSTKSSEPLFEHSFNSLLEEEDRGAFVTAACWKENVDVVIAGNSKGIVKVLGLKK